MLQRNATVFGCHPRSGRQLKAQFALAASDTEKFEFVYKRFSHKQILRYEAGNTISLHAWKHVTTRQAHRAGRGIMHVKLASFIMHEESLKTRATPIHYKKMDPRAARVMADETMDLEGTRIGLEGAPKEWTWSESS